MQERQEKEKEKAEKERILKILEEREAKMPRKNAESFILFTFFLIF